MTYVIWDHDRNQRVAAYSFQSAAKAEKAALRIAKQYSSYAASFKVIPLATAKKREKEQTIYRKATGNPGKWIPVTGVRLLPNGQVQIKVRRRS